MPGRFASLAILLGALLLGFTLARGAEDTSFQDLEESLTCQCGCGLTVHSCNHLQCGSAIPLRAEIRAQLAEGKNKEQVLDYFKSKYGEKILSSPTTTGFNLAAWITPFFLLAAGAAFVGVTLLRWRGRSPDEIPEAPPTPKRSGPAREYQKIFERELKQFDE